MHDAARDDECDWNGRKLCLKIRIVTGMQMFLQIITENRHRDTGLHTLQQSKCLDIDVIVDKVQALFRNCCKITCTFA